MRVETDCRILRLLLLTLAVLCLPGLAAAQLEAGLVDPVVTVLSPTAVAAPMSIDLDQLRNGDSDNPDETDGSPNWQNGNVGDQQGHLEEGWSIPYRARIENIPVPCYTGTDTIRIVLAYDVMHSGGHAIDYLTSYNRLHIAGSNCLYPSGNHNVDPYFPDPTYGTGLAGGAINDWTDAYPIPCPECDDPYGDLLNGIQPETSCGSLPAIEREMRIWGGQIVNMYYADYPLGTGNGDKCVESEEGDLTASQSEARMVVVIDPAGDEVVLAWGGHIGSRDDWGCEDVNGNTVPCGTLGSTPRSAGGISGSPYHMRLIDWEGFAEADCPTPNLGNTDRSLSAATICSPPLVCVMNVDTLTICEGADATLCVHVEGGLGPYTYDWTGPACPCGTDTCITILDAALADAGTYTVTITDQEGTETECSAVLVVVPIPPCSISGDLLVCPSSTGHVYYGPSGTYSYLWSIEGNGSIGGSTSADSVVVNAGDTCGADFVVTLIISEPTLGCADTCSYTVTVNDTVDPSVVSCPSDTTIDCSATPVFGTPTFDDNCDDALAVTYEQDTIPGACPAEMTVTRTWTATDDCGNTAVCDQSIRITDDTPPVIRCADDKTIDCAADVVFDDPSATDDCSEVTITILSTVGSAGDCPAESSFTRTWEAMDACGNADTCAQTVRRQDITDPVCSVPNDTSVFLCDPIEICLPVSATDLCDPEVSCEIVSGPGTLSGGEWCYMPAEDEIVDVVIRCTDDCGNSCVDTFRVSFFINEAPSCELGTPGPADECPPFSFVIQLTTTDPDGDSVVCTNTNPDVTFVDGVWSFTTEERGYTLFDTLICADVPCGEACTTIVAITTPNPAPPICHTPNDTTIYLCDTMEVCLPLFSDSGICRITSGPGVHRDSLWCYTPAVSETVTVGIECAAICDTCRDSFTVAFIINAPPSIECPEDSLVAQVGDTVVIEIPIQDDDDSALTVTIIGVTLDGVPTVPLNEPSIDSTGHFEWIADEATGVWCFTVVVADECAADTCEFCIEIPASREFCTLTQGAYGNPNGKFNGVVRTQLVYELLATPLVIGKPGRSVTFDQSDYLCIIERLPAGGPSDTLPWGIGDAEIDSTDCQTTPELPVDRKGKLRNILLGQTITLSLNLRLCCAELADLGLCPVFVTQAVLPGPDGLKGTEDDILNPGPDSLLGTADDPTSTHLIPQTVLDALDSLGLPQTVGELLELANRALGGWPTGGASLSTINYAVDAINKGFDECRFIIYCGDELPVVRTTSSNTLAKTVPTEYILDQNYPNPFNASTVISYTLVGNGHVEVAVFNILGQRVATLVDEDQTQGTYRVTWSGRDENGNSLSSGIYFYRLQMADKIMTRKMVLLK